MASWVSSVEAKASIIHAQMSMARELAIINRHNPEEACAPYLNLLNSLYKDEFPFAQLADSSDLVARFNGPSVDIYDPAMSIVITIFNDIRDQVRGIAKSIVGLSSDVGMQNYRVSWPSSLDPHLTGLAHGSLIVGISVPTPDESSMSQKQLELTGVSDQIVDTVRAAVRSIPLMARHVNDENVGEALREIFPDPAIRDTVMVATRKLAPTGRKGIDTVSFLSARGETVKPAILTAKSRHILTNELAAPVKQKGHGSFEGIVREIDLDARRFEIRNVTDIGSIRCAYPSSLTDIVKQSLDCKIRISGLYETLPSQLPRFISVEEIAVIERRPQQFELANVGLVEAHDVPRLR